MDIELERDLNEALARLSALSADQDGCEMKDPVVKMMLVALLHEAGKIKDMVDSVGQRILDRYCEDFIPKKEVSAMPAVAVACVQKGQGFRGRLLVVRCLVFLQGGRFEDSA